MTRWGMIIDLHKCIGCLNCVVACKQANKVPPDRWRRVVNCGVGEAPERQRTFLPMNCMHCDEPPCLEVCPTTATSRRPDGIVDVNYELCIGCGYCVVACPYLARTIFSGNESGLEVSIIAQMPGRPAPNPDYIGVASKCNFCASRLDKGLAEGLQPGIDDEATPACVTVCSAGVLHFGDLDDADSEVSRVIRENKTARLQEELGTKPAVYYIVA